MVQKKEQDLDQNGLDNLIGSIVNSAQSAQAGGATYDIVDIAEKLLDKNGDGVVIDEIYYHCKWFFFSNLNKK